VSTKALFGVELSVVRTSSEKLMPSLDEEPVQVRVSEVSEEAGGLAAVTTTFQRELRRIGVRKTVSSMLKINQNDGFDCPGCAWPEADGSERKRLEFCENGAKAVAEEAMTRLIDDEFWAQHSIADLLARHDYWLGEQGRIAAPVVRREGSQHYEPIGWTEAYDLIASTLRSLPSPNDAAFYTSGRTSNEAAFLLQLLARRFGTNNLPDCSNLCHEPTSVALQQAIGIGKGTVQLKDFEQADLIVLMGQNPGTNHPRMLTTLEQARKNGARIVAVNPLPEAGLLRFDNPQTPRGLLGIGTKLAELHLALRPGSDQALLQWLGRELLDRSSSGLSVIDTNFVAQHTSGFDDYVAHIQSLDSVSLLARTGLEVAEAKRFADLVADSKRMIVCWAMGVTQHVHATDTIREIVNVALLGGHIGRPGAGLCPVRGHSNVQGDRTMGIWDKPDPKFLARLGERFGFNPPSAHGFDVADTVEAILDKRLRVLFGLGGNFVRAVPDTEAVEAAIGACDLTVHVSTKLNRSHLATGRTALILPTLGRTEIDRQKTGRQRVTVEDSMSRVHASQGSFEPLTGTMQSEVAIVASIAERVFQGTLPLIDWAGCRDDYGKIREHIESVVDGFHAFEERIDAGAFVLPNPPRDARRFETSNGKAQFGCTTLGADDHVQEGVLWLQTVRSHDQFNTTIYGHDDRYRGISGSRNVILMHTDDIAASGIKPGDRVDIKAADEPSRRFAAVTVVEYPTPRGCVVCYYPEANRLFSITQRSATAGTPSFKRVPVRISPISPSRPESRNAPPYD
jgi:molybdopterin-dependent oxidoreductase alpha subunit